MPATPSIRSVCLSAALLLASPTAPAFAQEFGESGFGGDGNGAAPPDGLPLSPTAMAAVGVWQLEQLNGLDLPVLVDEWREDGRLCREHALSAALEMARDGHYRLEVLTRLDCGVPRRLTQTERGTWIATGNALYFEEEFVAGPGEVPSPADMAGIPIADLGGTGEVDGDLLTVGLDDGLSHAVFFRARRHGVVHR